MFEFLLGEKLAFSTYREDSFRRVTAVLTKKGIPYRAKIEGSGASIKLYDSAEKMGSRGIEGAEYRIYVKKEHLSQTQELAHLYK